MSYHKDSRNENVEFDFNQLRIKGPVEFESPITVTAPGASVFGGDVSVGGSLFVVHNTTTGGNLSVGQGAVISGLKNQTPVAEGVYMGADNVLPTNDVGVSILSNTLSYLDFSGLPAVFDARIAHDPNVHNLILYTSGTPAIIIDSAQRTTFNEDRIRISGTSTPASAAAAGDQGQICWDANYIYVCVATNTWKRVAIATW